MFPASLHNKFLGATVFSWKAGPVGFASQEGLNQDLVYGQEIEVPASEARAPAPKKTRRDGRQRIVDGQNRFGIPLWKGFVHHPM